jgi:hypothetical protein
MNWILVIWKQFLGRPTPFEHRQPAWHLIRALRGSRFAEARLGITQGYSKCLKPKNSHRAAMAFRSKLARAAESRRLRFFPGPF